MSSPPRKKKASNAATAAQQALRKRAELIGAIIQAERKLKGWTQTDLFKECAAKENKLRAKDDPHRVFNADRADGHHVIVDVERGRRKQLRKEWLAVFEMVFGWETGVLLNGNYKSIAGFKRLVVGPRSPQPKAKKGARAKLESDLNALPPLHEKHVSTGERLAFLRTLDRALRLTKHAPRKVTLIHGPAGLEKADLIREWCRDMSRGAFANILALDCTQPSDQLFRQVTRHFTGEPAESLEGLGSSLAAAGKTLIILVGLSDPQDSAAESAKPNAIVPIRTLLEIIARAPASVSVLLCVHTSPDGDVNAIAKNLGVSLSSPPLAVPPLDAEAAAVLLRTYGVDFLSQRDIEAIATEIAGLPLSLEYIAAYLKLLNKRDLEAFLAFDPNTPFSFEDFLKEYLKIAVPSDPNQDAHPVAFLRLLALTPQCASKELLEYILNFVEVGRLTMPAVSAFLREPPPGVRVSNNTFYLHTVVRNALWQDMAAALKRGDANLSETELTGIHVAAARFFVERFNGLKTEYRDIWARMLEGAVHHLLCVAMLARPSTEADARKPLEGIEHLADANIEPQSIVRYCFKELAEPHLCDSKHYASRYMGLFETKADILTRFAQTGYVGREGSPSQMLDTDQRIHLQIEIGVSWLHSGRLQPAIAALSSAHEETRRTLHVSAKQLADAWADPVAAIATGRKWRQHAQALSTLALSQLRHGRGAEMVYAVLDGDLPKAETIADLVSGERLTHETHKRLANGARRIIGRRAHLDLARGGLEKALERFHVATRLQKAAEYECLDGELARRYVETLVRSRASNPDHLELAKEIVARNLIVQTRDATKSKLRGESNEIIALFTSQAMLKRVEGKFKEAAEILAVAAKHPFVASGECPYAARKELEIEQARLKVVTAGNDAHGTLYQELLALERELANTRHAQLARQVMLMRAEILDDGDQKYELLGVVQTQAATSAWLLRLKDVEVLSNGDSALQILGC